MLTINPKEISIPALHNYLQGAVAPRPIAFVSSMDSTGNINLSPFSFFNVFGSNPPTLIFSPNRRVRDGSTKHTLDNVLVHDEVVINMVDYAMVEQMSLASCEYDQGVNEFIKAGFKAIPSQFIKPPRVAESKVSFECKVKQIIQFSDEGGSPNLVICEVLLIHLSEDILDAHGHIDQAKTDWVARLGGDWYCRASRDALFEIPKPSIHKGIGIDAIPEYIKNDPDWSKNELGRLGIIEHLPTQDEIDQYVFNKKIIDYKTESKQLLKNGKIKEAWIHLMYFYKVAKSKL